MFMSSPKLCSVHIFHKFIFQLIMFHRFIFGYRHHWIGNLPRLHYWLYNSLYIVNTNEYLCYNFLRYVKGGGGGGKRRGKKEREKKLLIIMLILWVVCCVGFIFSLCPIVAFKCVA